MANVLNGLGIIEKDVHGDVIWVWSFPSVEPELRDVILKKCCLQTDSNKIIPFIYGHFKNTWYYMYTRQPENGEALAKVTHFSLVILAQEFNPEKYETLGIILTYKYASTGNPAFILEAYLSVVCKGFCESEQIGTFISAEFDNRKALLSSCVKDVIRTFGVESILIYTALLIKKRVAVYHHSIEALLEFTRALPAMMWHRQNWNILYPNVHIAELDELGKLSCFVAGFTDPAVEGHSDSYDIFVNIPSTEITVSPQSKSLFVMTKLHKDIAMTLAECANQEDKTDEQLIQDIIGKTTELLNKLKSLCSNSDDDDPQQPLSLEKLKQHNLPTPVESFLQHVAFAERILTG